MNFAPPRPRLTLTELTERDLAVCELYKGGSDVLECGKPFKIGRESVYRILKKYGVVKRNSVPVQGVTTYADEPFPRRQGNGIESEQTEENRFESEVIRSGSKRKFQALSDEAQAVVRKMFKRHYQACESLNVPVDIQWLPDCVFEVARMAKLREKVAVNS